ncbi:eEF1A lysine and N-terminal methyltransferase [Punica granatum]|uniref:EEF1A lysine and N-terminal methyltransferase n=1 Tax=Punica granatum TaxID=22663 RepID=A0A6P8EKT6_PUNGR|nr:eEF1A lysine and N-terminal methyltransferase [Punica granatum]
MVKKKQQKHSQTEELLETLTDFTSKENWDKFFTIRGSDDSFEWYAEWPELRDSMLSELRSMKDAGPDSLQILVPGCGNSKLSEHLYDAGFHCITNIDFSKVVISDMLRRNVRERPSMRWRVMDMTRMQFTENIFDVVVDKGGLDALMEPEHGENLGNEYLTEAKRVLKTGGKFVCLTLAEYHVLGLLLPKFRFGWKMVIHAVPQKSSGKPGLRTFMVVAEKENSSMVHQITSSFSQSSLDRSDKQVNGLFEELNNENNIRTQYSDGSDILLSLKDLQLGAKGDLNNLSPGRRFPLILGDESSRFSYRAVLLDARQDSRMTVMYHCGIMLIPRSRANGWLYSEEEGQWTVVQSAKAARLIMVYLDNIHMGVGIEDIQEDLSPLVKQLAPAVTDYGSQIPFMMVEDALKERKIIHQVSSALTGPIIIDDVVYDNADNDISQILPSNRDLRFRRLIFQRNVYLVQSEALLTIDGMASAANNPSRADKKSKSKKWGSQRSNESKRSLTIFHDYLASTYHSGILSGFMLISSYLETMASAGNGVRTVVIGLGAGMIPMFLHGCLPFTLVEAVELDPIIVSLAKDYFGFREDGRLRVHTTDGLEFVKKVAESAHGGKEDDELLSSSSLEKVIDVLIVDVDSDDPSSGLSCPASSFVEETFLNDARASMSDQGLFVVNLVSRSASIKEAVISRMKKVFNHLYSLQLEQDVNEIIFALKTNDCIAEDKFPEAARQLEKLLNCREPKMREAIIDASKKIRYAR